jgi:hypothetical protein
MATFEHEQLRTGQAFAPTRDAHVFAAATGRRAGLLRAVGIAAGVLSLAWLAALALSLLGAGSLPGLLPGAADHVLPQRHQSPSAGRTVAALVRQRLLARPGARAAHPATAAVSKGSLSSHSASVVTAPVTTAPAAPTPTSQGQGWVRRGWSAPPGRTRRSQPQAAHGKQQTDGTKPTPGQSGSHVPPEKG